MPHICSCSYITCQFHQDAPRSSARDLRVMLGVSFSLTCHRFYLLNILQSVHFSSTVDFDPNPITFYWRLSNSLPDNLPVPGQVLFSIRVSYLKCQYAVSFSCSKLLTVSVSPLGYIPHLLVWDGDLLRI